MFKKYRRQLRMESLEQRDLKAVDFTNGLLTITGTPGDDVIDVSTQAGGPNDGQLVVDFNGQLTFISNFVSGNSVEVRAGDGDDTVSVDSNLTFNVTIYGGNGNDTLGGGDSASDFIFGEAGDDTMFGYGNSDWLSGGLGNDALHGGVEGDTLYGDEGDDNLDGSDGNDDLFGGTGNDTLDGGGDEDILWGEVGNDFLFGAEGNDECHGGKGDDTIHGNDDNDVIYGDAGNDTLTGDDLHDFIDGGKGNDNCHGNDGDDEIRGGKGTDTLDGDAGSNVLDGTGSDTLLNGIAGKLGKQMTADLTGPAGNGVAFYRVINDGGVLTNLFVFKSLDLPANTTQDIVVDGKLLGQVTVDGGGVASIAFSTNPGGGVLPLPDNFPRLGRKVHVTIPGLLDGVLVINPKVP